MSHLMKFSAITSCDAAISAKNIYKGLVVGGTMSDLTPGESGVVGQHAYINDFAGRVNFNWNGGLSDMSGFPDFHEWVSTFEDVARRAVPRTENGFTVAVVDQGGDFDPTDDNIKWYNMTYFLGPDAQGEDDGKSLVIFKGAGTVGLRRTSSGRQFGPSVILSLIHI